MLSGNNGRETSHEVRRAKKGGRGGPTVTMCFFAFLFLAGLLTLVTTALYGHTSEGAAAPSGSSLEEAKLREYQIVVDSARASIERHQLLEKGEDEEPVADLSAPLSHGEDRALPKAELKQSEATGASDSSGYDMPKVDVVIGMAQNTDPKNIAVFCKSLRRVSSAEVILFINEPIPDRHRAIAKENKITLKGFDLDKYGKTYSAFHPSTLRWALFYEFFQPDITRAKYKRVWLIDVRDSYFQSDPFVMLPSGESALYTFNGVESITLGQCGWNSGWVKDCFGQAVLSEISSKHIICSGVTMGDVVSVYAYLTVMDDVIMNKRKTAVSQSSKFPSCERNGVDQGVHNVLLHTKVLPQVNVNVKHWGQDDGPVMNMQAKKGIVGTDKVVRNSKGHVVAVVHQYDRDEALQRHLFVTYVDWVNTADPLAEWRADVECSKYEYHGDYDSFKGVCDFKMQGGATSPASCCSYCNRAKGCSGFTFFSGKCFLKNCRLGLGAGAAGAPLKGAVSGILK